MIRCITSHYVLLISFLFISNVGFAQKEITKISDCKTIYTTSAKADYKYLLSIPADALEKLSKQDNQSFQLAPWMSYCIDSVLYDAQFANLPYNQNLFELSIIKSTIYINPINSKKWNIFLVQNKEITGIKVIDAWGKEQKDCQVKCGKKMLIYDASTNLYLLKKASKQEKITVRKDQYIEFFALNAISPRPIHRLHWNFIFKKKDKLPPYNGYLAFNKPKYRPGDTMFIKAFVVDKNGKALQDVLFLKFTFYSYALGGNQEPINQPTTPTQPGNYVWEIPVTDTFIIDQSYAVALYDGYKHTGIYENIYIEDYELDKTSYSLSVISADNMFHYGDEIAFKAIATDANGLPVLDGKIDLYVFGSVSKLYQEQLFMPDTLWQYTSNLDPSGNTLISFPTHLIPNGVGSLNARADFTNSNNELHQAYVSTNFDMYAGKWQTDIGKDSFEVQFLKFGKLHDVELTLTAYNKEGNIIYTSKQKNPLRHSYHPMASQYKVTAENEPTPIIVYPNTDMMVDLKTGRKNDSFFMQVENPRGLQLLYTIYRNDKLFQKGIFSSAEYSFVISQPGKNDFHVELIGFWNGQYQSVENSYLYKSNSLDVTINGKSEVSPGETDNITVKITDAEGNPAQGVNITSGSVNTQFGQMKLPNVPYLGSDKHELPTTKKYALNRISNNYYYSLPEKSLDRFALDHKEYYDLSYPDKGKIIKFCPVNSEKSQLSLAVLKDGKRLKYYYVLIDGTMVQNSFCNFDDKSYLSYSGYKTIVIRTQNELITVDSVLLIDKWLTMLSVNLDKSHKDLHVSKMKSRLTSHERERIQSANFRLRFNSYGGGEWFLVTPDKIFPVYGNYYDQKYLVYGPFSPGTSMQLYNPAQKQMRHLTFDADFAYSIEEENLLFTEEKFPWKKNKKLKVKFEKDEDFYHVATEKELLKKELTTDAVFMSQLPFQGGAPVSFLSNETDRFTKMVFLPQTTGPVWPYAGLYNPLLPDGTYAFLLVDDSFRYFKTPHLEVHTGGVLYYQVPLKYQKVLLDKDREVMQVIGRKKYPEYFVNNTKSSLLVRLLNYENDQPLSNVQVQIIHADSFTRYYLNTDEWGYIYQTNLKPGFYSVNITTPGYERRLNFGWYISESKCAQYEERITTDPFIVELNRYRYYRYYGGGIYSYELASIQSVEVKSKRKAIHIGSRFDGSTSYAVEDESDFDSFKGFVEKAPQPPAAAAIWAIPDSTLPEANGNLPTLRTTFRDYAYWVPTLYTDEKGQVSFPVKYPDDITRWHSFAAAMNEKKQSGLGESYTRAYKKVAAELAVPRFAVEGDEIDAIGKVLNYTGKVVGIHMAFGESTNLVAKDTLLNSVIIQKIPLTFPAWNKNSSNVFSSKFAFTLTNGYQDGEQREIPVFPSGIEKAKGYFSVLENDTSFDLKAPVNGELIIHAENSSVDFLLQSLSRLEDYPYECNEQVSSKLRALLAQKTIQESLQLNFDKDKEIKKCIKLLEKAQNDDGSWGWWSRGRIDYYMTCYVLQSLHKAVQAGFETKATTKALELVKRLSDIVPVSQRIYALEIMAQMGVIWDYDNKIKQIPTKDLSTSDKFSIELIHALVKLPINEVWLKEQRKETYLGNAFYPGEQNMAWHSSMMNTLKVYQINNLSGNNAENNLIRRFFLEQKNGTYGWTNTLETATILENILNDFLIEKKSGRTASMQIVSSEGSNEAVFPFTKTFKNGEPVHIRYNGNQPVYFTAYERQWVRNPTESAEYFKVQTSFKQSGTETLNLKAGKKAVLEVNLKLNKYGEYFMLRVPIPSGCSYDSKETWGGAGEMHRSYYKNEVILFIDRLTPGTYSYQISLEPRFNGKQTLNPANMELMYFPTISGNNMLKTVLTD